MDDMKGDKDMKKDVVTGIIGAISGLTTIKVVHKAFKANQGKVGPIGFVGRLVTEAALGATAAGLAMSFADKYADVGKELYNEVLKKMGDEDGEDRRWKDGGMPYASQFVSKQDFYDLSKNRLISIRELNYYTEDGILTNFEDDIVDDPDLVAKIEKQLEDSRDERNGSSGILYYFRRSDDYNYSYYNLFYLYEIGIFNKTGDRFKIKEEEDGGES